MQFKQFAEQITKQFSMMQKHELFRLDVDGDEFWEKYLSSFPPGTNSIYRVRTEHDGSYDRHTLKKIGAVVDIHNGKMTTVWDIWSELESPYSEVAYAMRQYLQDKKIAGIFRSKEDSVGYVSTKERLEDGYKTWYHFYGKIDRKFCPAEIGEAVGYANTTYEVLKRGLTELTEPALRTVQDLIRDNLLYRGKEFEQQVANFRKMRLEYDKTPRKERDFYIWGSINHPQARFRNTVIGTLVVDLSNGVDITEAVGSFEAKVAPQNYKRPTALITQGMIDKAVQKIKELNLEDALSRRHAELADVSVNNVIWVSNSTSSKMKDGVASLLSPTAPVKASKDIAAIHVNDFIKDVLPNCTQAELLLESRHKGNLVSITTAAHYAVEPLFKWDNNFAWSYNGNVTDGIKEKVKKAGGNIHADLRVSLAWFNRDDLDLHCMGPYGHVCFMNKNAILDVDMNVSNPVTDPVENMAFMYPRDGAYSFYVNNYTKRDTQNVGFSIEVEAKGSLRRFTYNKAVPGSHNVECFSFVVKKGAITDFKVTGKGLEEGDVVEEVWNVKTGTYVPIHTVLYSPNHWDGNAVGNKHHMFILEGCKNPEPTRGIYNEFLRSDLEEHRKVFEVLGNKTMCEHSDEQLSGVGFSETVANTATIRAIGPNFNRTYVVQMC